MHPGQRVLIRQKVYKSAVDFKLPWSHRMSYSTTSTVLTLPFFSTFASLSFTSVNGSSVPLLDFCDFDVPPLCEARIQLMG
nr:hypothetical protein HmN_000787300 [Hymenolepis microstoma]